MSGSGEGVRADKDRMATAAVAEATEHGYLIICNGEAIAFRYGGSAQEVRMVRSKPVSRVLGELAATGWTLCPDARRPTKGAGDYELKLERKTVRPEVHAPSIDLDTSAELAS